MSQSFDHLPAEQAEQARQIRAALQEAVALEIDRLAELLASKPDSQILGQTEFEVRDRVHRIGAKAIEAALNGRKKGATKAPA
jgi:hypothetical protein